MTHRSSLTRRLLCGALLPFVAVLAAACGSSSKAGSSATTNTTTAVAARTQSGELAGTWAGSYSGAFKGTFSLTWQQAGSNLTGTIKISGFGNEPTDITGSVQGDKISFGTVGSQAITYTGSASGNSMSGDWQIQAGGRTLGTGSWSANKSS